MFPFRGSFVIGLHDFLGEEHGEEVAIGYEQVGQDGEPLFVVAGAEKVLCDPFVLGEVGEDV